MLVRSEHLSDNKTDLAEKNFETDFPSPTSFNE